jgi:hypothetical protein
MDTAGVDSGLETAKEETPGIAASPPSLSPAQRKALAEICRLHEHGFTPRRFSRRSLLLALYIVFVLAFCVLLQFMTAFAGPAYLFLGFVLGALLKELRILMIFRRVWPVYEAIIDWPRAFGLLRAADKLKAGGLPQSDASSEPPGVTPRD